MPQAGTHLAELARPCGGIGGDSFGLFGRLGLKPHVGTDGLTGVVPVDFMAAEAAILTDQLVAFKQFRSCGTKRWILTQLHDVVMALEAG